jgi:hypothetical protein
MRRESNCLDNCHQNVKSGTILIRGIILVVMKDWKFLIQDPLQNVLNKHPLGKIMDLWGNQLLLGGFWDLLSSPVSITLTIATMLVLIPPFLPDISKIVISVSAPVAPTRWRWLQPALISHNSHTFLTWPSWDIMCKLFGLLCLWSAPFALILQSMAEGGEMWTWWNRMI